MSSFQQQQNYDKETGKCNPYTRKNKILYKCFQKVEEGRTLPNSFYEAWMTLYQNPKIPQEITTRSQHFL